MAFCVVDSNGVYYYLPKENKESGMSSVGRRQQRCKYSSIYLASGNTNAKYPRESDR